MRLWHWKLIPVLPRQQLLGQWRECCLIAKEIKENGTPNHILVNSIMNYPLDHFCWYTQKVCHELSNRGYYSDFYKFVETLPMKENGLPYYPIKNDLLFSGWHNDQYLQQCYQNLQEKHDRGGITDEEWQKIEDFCKGE